MPQLPDFESLGERPVPQADMAVAKPQPSSMRYANLPGMFMREAGQEMLQTASNINKSDETAAHAAINQLNDADMRLHVGPQGFANVTGQPATTDDFIKNYTTQFNDAKDRISQGLASEGQRQLFDRFSVPVATNFQGKLLQHRSQQQFAFDESTDQESIRSEINKIATLDPSSGNYDQQIAMSQARLDEVARRRAERLGLPEDKEIDKAEKTLWTGVAVSTLTYDPSGRMTEQLLRDHADKVGEAFPHLWKEADDRNQDFEARNLGHWMIANGIPMLPKTYYGAIQGHTPLEAGLLHAEGGVDAAGNRLVSAKGAKGPWQVEPATAKAPGLGVTPAKDESDAELDRVGKEYFGALLSRYNEPAIALAAYNAGYGRVDKWLQDPNIGDPRQTGVSPAQWIQKIPFDETRGYVTRALTFTAQQGGPGAPGQLSSNPTVAELKQNLTQYTDGVRQMAEQMRPNNPAFRDRAVAHFSGEARMVLDNARADQDAAWDQVTRIQKLGPNLDGQNLPQTLEQAMSIPTFREAYNRMTPEKQAAAVERYGGGPNGPPKTDDTQALRAQLEGQAGRDPDKFMGRDFVKEGLHKVLPHSDFDYLTNLQLSMRRQEMGHEASIQDVDSAMKMAGEALKSVGAYPDPVGTTRETDHGKAYDQFRGIITREMNDFRTTNGHRPKAEEIQQMVGRLTTQIPVPGEQGAISKLLGRSPPTLPAFQLIQQNREQEGQFPVTPQLRATLAAGFRQRYGREPSDSDIQAIRSWQVLHPNDPDMAAAMDQRFRAPAGPFRNTPATGKITTAQP
jgi:hypothetical protein